MLNLTSKNGKIGNATIYNCLRKLYEVNRINEAVLNGRVIWFDNVSWQYADTIPAELFESMETAHNLDKERLAK